jgi:hypothetical protein
LTKVACGTPLEALDKEATMLIFLAIGAAGVVLLIISALFDGVIDIFDLGDGLLSGPAIASFVGAFGFAGALAVRGGLSQAAAVAVGAAAGAAVGGLAGLAARSLMRMPTDATVSASSYLGLTGVVITAIGPGSIGEVSVTVGGQPTKMSARSADGAAIAAGRPVTIEATPSPTLVIVSTTGAPGATVPPPGTNPTHKE